MDVAGLLENDATNNGATDLRDESKTDDAESDARSVLTLPDDPRFLFLADRWPALPEDIRDAICRLAEGGAE